MQGFDVQELSVHESRRTLKSFSAEDSQPTAKALSGDVSQPTVKAMSVQAAGVRPAITIRATNPAAAKTLPGQNYAPFTAGASPSFQQNPTTNLNLPSLPTTATSSKASSALLAQLSSGDPLDQLFSTLDTRGLPGDPTGASKSLTGPATGTVLPRGSGSSASAVQATAMAKAWYEASAEGDADGIDTGEDEEPIGGGAETAMTTAAAQASPAAAGAAARPHAVSRRRRMVAGHAHAPGAAAAAAAARVQAHAQAPALDTDAAAQLAVAALDRASSRGSPATPAATPVNTQAVPAPALAPRPAVWPRAVMTSAEGGQDTGTLPLPARTAGGTGGAVTGPDMMNSITALLPGGSQLRAGAEQMLSRMTGGGLTLPGPSSRPNLFPNLGNPGATTPVQVAALTPTASPTALVGPAPAGAIVSAIDTGNCAPTAVPGHVRYTFSLSGANFQK